MAIIGGEIARRPETIAVKRCANHFAIGEHHGGRPIPWLHQRSVMLIKSATIFIHQRVASPCLRDHHHHGMGQRIATHGEKL